MNALIPIFIVGFTTYCIYSIFELFVHRKERMAIIEKLSSDISLDLIKSQLNLFKKEVNTGWAIRIGCLLLGIGLGLSIVAIIDMNTAQISVQEFASLGNNAKWTVENSPHYAALNILYPAFAAFFGGLGLVISYFIEVKINNKRE